MNGYYVNVIDQLSGNVLCYGKRYDINTFTINGVDKLKVGGTYILSPIYINEKCLTKALFVQWPSSRKDYIYTNVNAIWDLETTDGWLLEIVEKEGKYFYVEPVLNESRLYQLKEVSSIEELQFEVYAAEGREILLPLLDSILNKHTLYDSLMQNYNANYSFKTYLFRNGNYKITDSIDDYDLLTIEPMENFESSYPIEIKFVDEKTVSVKVLFNLYDLHFTNHNDWAQTMAVNIDAMTKSSIDINVIKSYYCILIASIKESLIC